MPPGQSVQLVVIGHFADGSTHDVTKEVAWTVGSAVLAVDPASGRATGILPGESAVTVRLRSITATTEIVVVPTGTFRVSVLVREGGGTIDDVRVDVTDGRGQSFSDTTAVNGRFDVYGVAGDSQVRVTGAAYQDHVQRVAVIDHLLLTVEMVAVRPRSDISGSYTLTIAADAGCADRLPEDLRTRRYGAQVSQAGRDIVVSLQGVALVTNSQWGGRFTGRTDGSSSEVVFNLAVDFYYASYYLNGTFLYPPDVFERLGGSRYFGASGRAVTRVSATALSGVLDGSMWISDAMKSWPARVEAECRSTQHAFVLSR